MLPFFFFFQFSLKSVTTFISTVTGIHVPNRTVFKLHRRGLVMASFFLDTYVLPSTVHHPRLVSSLSLSTEMMAGDGIIFTDVCLLLTVPPKAGKQRDTYACPQSSIYHTRLENSMLTTSDW